MQYISYVHQSIDANILQKSIKKHKTMLSIRCKINGDKNVNEYS